jgi:hypothetical protein
MNEPQIGDLVTAELESLDRIIADIEAWCRDERDDQPIDFICELLDRLVALRAMERG